MQQPPIFWEREAIKRSLARILQAQWRKRQAELRLQALEEQRRLAAEEIAIEFDRHWRERDMQQRWSESRARHESVMGARVSASQRYAESGRTI